MFYLAEYLFIEPEKCLRATLRCLAGHTLPMHSLDYIPLTSTGITSAWRWGDNIDKKFHLEGK